MSIFNYYGLDIIAAILCSAQIVLLGQYRREGWLCGFLGCALFCIFGAMTQSLAVILMNCVLGFIDLYYYIVNTKIPEA